MFSVSLQLVRYVDTELQKWGKTIINVNKIIHTKQKIVVITFMTYDTTCHPHMREWSPNTLQCAYLER